MAAVEGQGTFRRVLVVARNPSDLGLAVRRALELVDPRDATLTLMTSVRGTIRGLVCSPYAVPFTQKQLADECEQEARELFARAAANLPAHVTVKTVVVRGDVVSCVCEQVQVGRHDVIVLQRGRRLAQRRLRPRAQVPVVVV